MIFHALDPNSNEIVDFDTFIANLDEEIFFDAVQECHPETITVRRNKSKQTCVLMLSFVVCDVTFTNITFCSSRYLPFIVDVVY